MPIYKASVVILDSDQPGSILNLDESPTPGKTIEIGGESFIVEEVIELTPPRGEFHFLHVTLRTKKEPQ